MISYQAYWFIQSTNVSAHHAGLFSRHWKYRDGQMRARPRCHRFTFSWGRVARNRCPESMSSILTICRRREPGKGRKGDVGAVLDGMVREGCSEEVACEQRP